MTIGTNKILIVKNNLTYLDIGEINEQKITQNLFTEIDSVDKFNENILNLIQSYEMNGFHPKLYNMFDIIEQNDITAFVIKQLKWRRCSAYLVIQTSNIGYRYLCYFYDKIYHSAECFGTSYNLVEKSEIINHFENKFDEMKDIVDFNRFPELNEPILNRTFDTNFGIA